MGSTPASAQARICCLREFRVEPTNWVLTDNLGERSKVELLGLVSRHEDQSRGTIGERGRVGGGDRTVLLEGGAEGRDLLEDDALVLLILADNGVPLLALDRHGDDLGVKGTLLPCTCRALVGLDGMVVLRLTGDAVLLSRVLTTVAHGEVVVDIPETVGLERVTGGELAERRVRAGQEEAAKIPESIPRSRRVKCWGRSTYGALLMLSIPPAATTERSPSLMDWAASMTAFMPLAQTLLMVVASELDLRPDERAT
jgi:hypothetical protein